MTFAARNEIIHLYISYHVLPSHGFTAVQLSQSPSGMKGNKSSGFNNEKTKQTKPKNKPMSVAGHGARFMDPKVQAQNSFEQKGLGFTSLLLTVASGK